MTQRALPISWKDTDHQHHCRGAGHKQRLNATRAKARHRQHEIKKPAADVTIAAAVLVRQYCRVELMYNHCGCLRCLCWQPEKSSSGFGLSWPTLLSLQLLRAIVVQNIGQGEANTPMIGRRTDFCTIVVSLLLLLLLDDAAIAVSVFSAGDTTSVWFLVTARGKWKEKLLQGYFNMGQRRHHRDPNV